jgi:protein TonB
MVQPIETKIIEEHKPPPPEVPLPPPPKLDAPPPPYIPTPEVQIQQPPQHNVISAVTTVKPAAPTAPFVREEGRQPVRVPPVIDAAKNCKKPPYPPASERLRETGTVVLRFLIDVDGRVLSSQVQSSSAHERLDEAARHGLSLCQFKPGMIDGQPEQAWATLRYTWELNEE